MWRSTTCWRSWANVSPTDPRRWRVAAASLSCLFAALCLLASATVQATGHPSDLDEGLRDALRQAIEQSSSFEDRFDAEVWLLDMSLRIERYVEPADERLHILRAVHREAARAELPVDLVMGVIHTESHFQRFAISSAGAQGLMQVMPFWKNEIGRPDDNLTDIDTNLRYGCTILSYYLRRAKGDLTEALARYNGSYGRYTYPEKVFVNQQRYEE